MKLVFYIRNLNWLGGPDDHDREHVFTVAEFWYTLKQRIRHL